MSKPLANKTYVITGATAGIGRITAREIAKQGARVILACRSREKTLATIEELKKETGNDQIEFVKLDLGDLASVREAAKEILAKNVVIDGLVNNAGLAGQRGQTKDGFELAFGTNHLGHYLFTRLLLDRIKAAGTARIVTVSSKSHYRAKSLDWDAVKKPTQTMTALREYEASKLANVLFTKELARRLAGTKVTTYAVHPGVVATDNWKRVPPPFRWLMKKFMLTPEQGAGVVDQVRHGSRARRSDGALLRRRRRRGRSRTACPEDVELAKTLWQKSAEWVGLS